MLTAASCSCHLTSDLPSTKPQTLCAIICKVDGSPLAQTPPRLPPPDHIPLVQPRCRRAPPAPTAVRVQLPRASSDRPGALRQFAGRGHTVAAARSPAVFALRTPQRRCRPTSREPKRACCRTSENRRWAPLSPELLNPTSRKRQQLGGAACCNSSQAGRHSVFASQSMLFTCVCQIGGARVSQAQLCCQPCCCLVPLCLVCQ